MSQAENILSRAEDNLSPANSSAPQHAPMTQFPVRDQQLQVGGNALTALALRAGQTPFYAYDRTLIQQRVDELRPISALPDRASPRPICRPPSLPV